MWWYQRRLNGRWCLLIFKAMKNRYVVPNDRDMLKTCTILINFLLQLLFKKFFFTDSVFQLLVLFYLPLNLRIASFTATCRIVLMSDIKYIWFLTFIHCSRLQYELPHPPINIWHHVKNYWPNNTSKHLQLPEKRLAFDVIRFTLVTVLQPASVSSSVYVTNVQASVVYFKHIMDRAMKIKYNAFVQGESDTFLVYQDLEATTVFAAFELYWNKAGRVWRRLEKCNEHNMISLDKLQLMKVEYCSHWADWDGLKPMLGDNLFTFFNTKMVEELTTNEVIGLK